LKFEFPPHANLDLLENYIFNNPHESEKTTALNLWKFIFRLRSHQLALIKEYHPLDEMRCPIHFCIGQEAVPAVLSEVLQDEDFLFSNHRSHGYFLSKGGSADKLYLELFGKKEGANGGRAGSQEISCPQKNFFSGAILTGTTSIAVGVAHSMKLQGTKYISVSTCGDGATDEGAFWEALNFSAVNNLPILFVVENNNFATFKPYNERFKKFNIAEKAEVFGVNSKILFGNDPIQLHREICKSVSSLRNGGGPELIETVTYRMNSHVGPESDEVNQYRTSDDLNLWEKLCPLKRFQDLLVSESILSREFISAYSEIVNKEIIDSFRVAREGAWPDLSEIMQYRNQTDFNFNEIGNSHLNKVSNLDSIPGPY
jgi:TPP-dependent pyruvate/acetoin dehydrogenase alpha subunit